MPCAQKAGPARSKQNSKNDAPSRSPADDALARSGDQLPASQGVRLPDTDHSPLLGLHRAWDRADIVMASAVAPAR
jgi:hypothetical protein